MGTCDACANCIDIFLPILKKSESNAFMIDVDVRILNQDKCKQDDRKRKLSELNIIVSGLQNTKGGVILVHVKGGSKTGQLLTLFDKFFQQSFIQLIGDDDLYTNKYKRQWLSHPDIANECFLRLNVKKTEGVSTVDYNTKIRTDCTNINPLLGNIAKLIESHQNRHIAAAPDIGPLRKTKPTEEDRSVVVKVVDSHEHKTFKDTEQIVNYFWLNLELKNNVTSMSKVNEGGTIYFDVSNSLRKTGSPFLNPEAIVKAVKEKIYQEISAIDARGEFKQNIDLCHVDHVNQRDKDNYLIRVFVKPFDGIVFCDKRGPCAYIINDGKVVRMLPEIWYKEMRAFALRSNKY